MTETYDLVVVGGGSGGLTAAIIAGRVGAKVLLVDRERLGGDCLHHGCVPSKALIASARLAHQMGNAHRWGLTDRAPGVDFPAVMARIRAIQDAIGAHESPEALDAHGVEVAFGGARFKDAHTLCIGEDREVTARNVVLATGARPRIPGVAGLEAAGWLDNTSVFDLEILPRRLVVIGGGPIGCELGQAFARLGSAVTILQRGERLVPKESPEIGAILLEALRAEGLDVRLETEARGVRLDGEDRVLELPDAELRCDAILVATGRAAAVESLDLAAAGVETNARGIIVDESLRTSQSHIYAVGDCNGGPQFTHWAEHEARIAARNLLFRGSDTRRSLDLLPRVTFTDPEIASVGPSWPDAKAQGAHRHRVAHAQVDRAMCEGYGDGFTEVIVDKKDRVLGVHAVGHLVGEQLGEWVLAMEQGVPLGDLGSIIHAYPTFGRAVRRAADERFYAHGVPRWQAALFGRFKGG